MRHVFTAGVPKSDRTGTGTVSVFGYQMRFDLGDGFPLVTTKRVHFPSVANELLWFLRGEGNMRSLQEDGVTIWDEWADESGDLGPVYGVQWRSWPTPDGGHIDQIAEAVRLLREEPDSRRIIVSAWNVAELPKMALMPCHAFFQFYVADGRAELPALPAQRRRLPRRAVQHRELRAADAHARAAVPISSVGELVWTGGDCHIYDNHREQVETQLARDAVSVPDAAPRAAGRRRSSTTRSRTSRWSTTSTTRRSGLRSRCEGLARRRRRARRRDRPRRHAAVAAAGGRAALPRADDRPSRSSWAAGPGTRCPAGSGRCPAGATSSSRATRDWRGRRRRARRLARRGARALPTVSSRSS